MDCVLRCEGLKSVVFEDALDCVFEDLDPGSDPEAWSDQSIDQADLDYTACDKECGYCGRCMY